VLGPELRAPLAADIDRTLRLVALASGLMVALFTGWAALRGQYVGIDF
jgi:cobalamin biosynthesis protein CobD/CbiB